MACLESVSFKEAHMPDPKNLTSPDSLKPFEPYPDGSPSRTKPRNTKTVRKMVETPNERLAGTVSTGTADAQA